MAVKLRLKRMGRKNGAFYRLKAMDSRSPRDGRVIEELGHYDPRQDPIEINVDAGDVDAQRFYERQGFSGVDPDTGERAFYYSLEL